ncbi:hypothetical protein GCM10022409_02930 [Hymenobacter glaciei]|uniref:Uncharacterized protein n=1 Tax=Hymenobacter glaciei TaxID=877209 RepID=A0ABP7T8H8_9BACT
MWAQPFFSPYLASANNSYLIDDEPLCLYLTEQMLRREDADAAKHTCAGTNSVRAYLLPHPASELSDVVFLGLHRPGLSGVGFTGCLAATRGCADGALPDFLAHPLRNR